MNPDAPLGNSGAAIGVAIAVAGLIALYAVSWWVLYRSNVLWRRFRPHVVQGYVAVGDRSVPARLAERYPRVYSSVAGRFDPRRFTGLPLTLLVVAAAYLGVLFVGLVEVVMESEEADALDEFVVALVAPWRNPWLVNLFSGITQLGSTATLAAVAIVSTGFLWASGPAWGIAPVWIAIAGSQATTWTGKFLIDRARPDFVLDVTAWSPSFPSGHATGAMAVYGILAYVISRDLSSRRRRFDVVFWTGVLIATIAFSRIYLSVHHPTDVAAGLLVGGFWVLAGIAAAEILRDRD